MLLLFFAKIIASVDEQIQVWDAVYKSFHSRGADWKTTYVPELIDRIRFTGNYVEKAIELDSERVERLYAVLIAAEKRNIDQSLTFQHALRFFDEFAKICDKKKSLDPLTGELPESIFDKHFATSRSFLKNSDIYFLCVPKAMLKIERFVDGYLQERPVQYVAIANQKLERGGHGDFYKTVYDTYYHDLQHAHYFMVFGGRYFKSFWPGYRVIKEIRQRLNSFEKNIVDCFLHTYFHEIYADAYKFYKSSDRSFTEPVGLDTNPEVFSSFIDKMELANTRFDLRINFDAINWSKKDIAHYSELISLSLNCPYNSDTIYRLRNSSSFLIEDYLPSSPTDIIKIEDVLEITNKHDSSIIEEIPCEVEIENISSPISTVHISSNEKICTFQIYGPGHKAPHYFQDVLYLLKLGGYINAERVHDPVTIFNYAEIRELAVQMRAVAMQFLKDKFTLYISSLSR